MEDRREGERLQHAMTVYEAVQMVLERLRDVNAELDASEFASYEKVITRAREHLQLANDELEQLAELMRWLHMRPSEDSSEDPLQT